MLCYRINSFPMNILPINDSNICSFKVNALETKKTVINGGIIYI